MSPNSIYIIVSSIFFIVIGNDIYNWSNGRKILTPEIRIQRLREKINRTILILGLTCLAASILFHINIFDYHAPIEYKDVSSITLRDFKGFKLPNQTLSGEKDFAFIVTSIEYDTDDTMVEVKAMFHPSRSYVYSENLVSKTLLEHELYHFHITEVFAREIREQLSGMKMVPTAVEIRRLVDAKINAERKMQMEYDYETYHSYVLKKQKAWQGKIDSLLSSHLKFDQSIVQFPLMP